MNQFFLSALFYYPGLSPWYELSEGLQNQSIFTIILALTGLLTVLLIDYVQAPDIPYRSSSYNSLFIWGIEDRSGPNTRLMSLCRILGLLMFWLGVSLSYLLLN